MKKIQLLRFSFVWEKTNFENTIFCYFTQRTWYGREPLSKVREWTSHVWVESTIQDEQVLFKDYFVFTNQAEKYFIEFYFENNHMMFHLFWHYLIMYRVFFYSGISCI